MDAGKLYERVAFDSPLESSDGQGGGEDGWQEAFSCRANYRRLRGGERVQASRLEGVQPTVITVRRSSQSDAVTTDWRIRDVRSGETFNIRTKVRTDDRAFYEFTCESGVAV